MVKRHVVRVQVVNQRVVRVQVVNQRVVRAILHKMLGAALELTVAGNGQEGLDAATGPAGHAFDLVPPGPRAGLVSGAARVERSSCGARLDMCPLGSHA